MNLSIRSTINPRSIKRHSRNFDRPLPGVLILTLALTLAACDHRLIFIQAPPDAVMVTKLPINLAVHFEESFANSLYKDKAQQQGLRNIDFGDAQTNMFQRILGTMFADLQFVSDAANLPDGTQALLNIGLKDFQFSTPRQSYTKSCEVWLNYELAFYTPQGELISDINLSAYGSASVSGGRSYPYYVKLALNRAIRDAGARLVVELPRNPKIIHIVETLSNGERDS